MVFLDAGEPYTTDEVIADCARVQRATVSGIGMSLWSSSTACLPTLCASLIPVQHLLKNPLTDKPITPSADCL